MKSENECISELLSLLDKTIRCENNIISDSASFNLKLQYDSQKFIETFSQIAYERLENCVSFINKQAPKKYDVFLLEEMQEDLITYTGDFIISYLSIKLCKDSPITDLFKNMSTFLDLFKLKVPSHKKIVDILIEEYPEAKVIIDRYYYDPSVNQEQAFGELEDIVCIFPPLFIKDNICKYVLSSINDDINIMNSDLNSELSSLYPSIKAQLPNNHENKIKAITSTIPVTQLKLKYITWFLTNKGENKNWSLAVKRYENKVALLNDHYIPFLINYVWELLRYLVSSYDKEYIVISSLLDSIQSGMVFTSVLLNNSHISDQKCNLKLSPNYEDYICFDNIKLNSNDLTKLGSNIHKYPGTKHTVFNIAKQGIMSYANSYGIPYNEYIEEMAMYIEECIYTSVFLCNDEKIDVKQLTDYIQGKSVKLIDDNSNYFSLWRFINDYKPILKISKTLCDYLGYSCNTTKINKSILSEIQYIYNTLYTNNLNVIIKRIIQYSNFKKFILKFLDTVENETSNPVIQNYKINSLERSYCFNLICTLLQYITSDKKIKRLKSSEKMYLVESLSALAKVPLITYRKNLLKTYIYDVAKGFSNAEDIAQHIHHIKNAINYSALFVISIINSVDKGILYNSLENPYIQDKFKIIEEFDTSKLESLWFKKISRNILEELHNQRKLQT